MKQLFFLLTLIFSANAVISQTTHPVNGVPDKVHNYYAFKNATIYIDYQTKVENAILLVNDGKVVEAGPVVVIPNGAVVFDLKGKYIYPSFIDLYSNYGMPKVKIPPKQEKRFRKPQFESAKKGAFSWNQAIKPETNSGELFSVDTKKSDSLRKLGFGAVLTHQQDGIARGTSAFVTLGDRKSNEEVIVPVAAAHYSFKKGSSTQNYPGSLMGAIALLRQTYYDAVWYKDFADKDERNISLAAFNNLQNLPQIFEVRDHLSVLRADTLGDEFGVQYIIKGVGDEYRRLVAVKATNAPMIIPLNFPKPYNVEDPYDALNITLAQMKHWELAPANPAYLQIAGVPFCFTLSGLKKGKDFWVNLREAVKRGLNKETALMALTYTPAKLLGRQAQIGSLHPGMIANFIITSHSIFDKKMILFENWVQGCQYKYHNIDQLDIRGEYSLNINKKVYEFRVKGEIGKPKVTLVPKDTTKKTFSLQVQDRLVSIHLEIDDDKFKGHVRLTGKISQNGGLWDGIGQLPDGTWVDWNAIKKRKTDFIPVKPDTSAQDSFPVAQIWFPNMAYGFTELPQPEDLLIKNARVWTNVDTLGILEKTNVLIQGGKITAMGTNFEIPEEIVELDVGGKNLTPGIIDEHSHIAISRGVNEGSQAVSAEVRIGDVINCNDINIYRQLAGGVTVAQLLHGSANPIGGQSALIKLRWGYPPEAMKIQNADGFIKFALGENVKQSNWGDLQRIRFPQTRMGVEQVFYDGFIRAKEYQVDWGLYNGLKEKERKKRVPPRRDLELETLAEILNNERFITCHSYEQSEINMLIHVADSMGFKINTFTHILEGYKVADKMAEHGAGGSTFSDWWAYKFEVNDAIPYNMALMHQQGIITAVNSDDAEMGRRLNQEAAKAIKYGGMSEQEALKIATLNPAKLLHLDHQMGKIAPGMDADFVIWSDHPLSVYAKAEKTFVDGILFFDIERDRELRKTIAEERARLIQKMIDAKKKGAATQKPTWKKNRTYHCDTIEDEG